MTIGCMRIRLSLKTALAKPRWPVAATILHYIAGTAFGG
jgi:hypothetical protein